MLLQCQKSSIGNAFEEGQLIFKSPSPEVPVPISTMDLDDAVGFQVERKKTPLEKGSETAAQKMPDGLGSASTEAHEEQDKDKGESQRRLKVAHERFEGEIFENDEERDAYATQSGEALADHLDEVRQFLKAHKSKRGNVPVWNADLTVALGLEEEETSGSTPSEDRRIVAGLQLFLKNNSSETGRTPLYGSEGVNDRIDGCASPYLVKSLGIFLKEAELTPKIAISSDSDKEGEGEGEEDDEDGAKARESKIPPKENPEIKDKSKGSPDIEKKLNPETASRIQALSKDILSVYAFPLGQIEKAQEKQREDLIYLRDEKNNDPHAWFYINNFTDQPGSWPDRAFKDYVNAYDKAGKPESIIKYPELVERFDRLGQAVGADLKKIDISYLGQCRKIQKAIDSSYDPQISALVNKYDLPDKTDVTQLDEEILIQDMEGRLVSVPNPIYFSQRINVVPEQYRNREKLQELFKQFFNDVPNKIFKEKWEDVSKTCSNPEQLKQIFSGDDEPTIIGKLNQMILFENLYRMRDESKKLKADVGEYWKKMINELNNGYSDSSDSGGQKPIIAQANP